MKIDSHQHFWRYDAVQYDWIEESLGALRRDFLPADLATCAAQTGVRGTVAVQARQSLEETDWLLALADDHPELIKGVVGWIPLREKGSGIDGVLDHYSGHRAFKGVRHVLQGEPDAYMDDPSFNAAVSRLGPRGLSYDLLIFSRQLPAATAFVDRHPGLPIVLDHIAKPVVQGAPPVDWVAGLRELARRDNVWCKFSGVVTEAPGWTWSPGLVKSYFDVALEAFGPSRLMFGSDWPVCQVAVDYLAWHRTVAACAEALSSDERDALFGGNASSFYRL